MQAVGTIAKLAENVIGRTVHAVIHPVETLALAAGFAKGAASAVVSGRRPEGEWVEPSAGDRPAGMPDLPPPLPPIEGDADTGEAFVTEPHSPSRNAEHGGPGDDTIDDWRDELEEAPDLSVGEQVQPDTEPLMDPSLTKAVKSESETLQKAADLDKG